jgi:broad specificity phosphatase PhoE
MTAASDLARPRCGATGRAGTAEGMRLFLVRHGDAHAGFHGVIGGRHGCPGLTDLGRRQAEALRDHLAATRWIQPEVVVASTLPRAIETAQIIGPGVGLQIESQHDDLIELDPGDADGLTWAEYDVHHGGFDMEAEPDRVFAPEGESWNSFHDRVRRMLERLAADHSGETVMAVCHAGVIMASMRILLGIPHGGAGAQLRPTNTGVTEWSYEPDQARWTLRCFNATPHLVGLDT